MTALADAYARASAKGQAYAAPKFQTRAEKVRGPNPYFDFAAELEKAASVDAARHVPKDRGLNDVPPCKKCKPDALCKHHAGQIRPLHIHATYPRKTQKRFGQQGSHNEFLADKLHQRDQATAQAYRLAPVQK